MTKWFGDVFTISPAECLDNKYEFFHCFCSICEIDRGVCLSFDLFVERVEYVSHMLPIECVQSAQFIHKF